MVYCSKCGKQMDDSATFCSGCGTPLQNQINYAVPDINKARKELSQVQQDYGVAAMALGKGVYAIHQSGKWYTNENIDQMLMERHLNKKARRSSHKNHMKGPRKRTEEDDVRFAQSFEKLILMAKSKEGAQSGTI